MNKKIIGDKGEDIAENYLKKKGYKIIERNFKTRSLEIDIIAEKENILVFVEVRSKTKNNFGTPEETIDFKKLRKLKSNAEKYINYKKYNGVCRIDAICIIFKNKNKVKLNHYKNIIF